MQARLAFHVLRAVQRCRFARSSGNAAMRYARERGSSALRCTSLFASIAAGILATAHAAPARALELVSVRDGSSAAAGGQEPALSKDGRYVAFEARTGNVVPGDQPTYSDVFVRDRGTGR